MPKIIQKSITHRGNTYIPIPRFCEIVQIDKRTYWRRVKDGTLPQPTEVLGTNYVPEKLALDILDAAFGEAEKISYA